MERETLIIGPDDPIVVTGATGFIGVRLVESLLVSGFRNVRCFARPSSAVSRLEAIVAQSGGGRRIEVVKGNLLSREDCAAATKDVAVIFHLAAGRGEESFPAVFINSVVTTRNFLQSRLQHARLRGFFNINAFAVYTNTQKPRWVLVG